MEHPHAEFLRAIADGDDLNQWVCSHPQHTSNNTWSASSVYCSSILCGNAEWKVWRKPKTLTYSVTIPEPIMEAPPVGTRVYWADSEGFVYDLVWHYSDTIKTLLKNRQLFDTDEKARIAFIRRNGLEEE